ncbi:MAG TPA: sigma 54-interacting transcriptional regulator [Polyangiaceae bacterium]|jgi:DNA-binding NtrC family response regulator|nr:sigma 54-interacting transcriptional regulator [Polyangiaceae bacterium]
MSRERDKSEEAGTATIVRAPSARPLGAVLRVMRDDTAGPAYRLKTGKCVIGSGKGCDLVIADTTVSRTHVELELVPEGVRVHDLGSRNGTFYVGQRIDTMVLGLGSRITLGATPLAIEPDGDALADGSLYAGDEFRGMVGVSNAMRRLFATLARLEGSLATVLVTGESGVGKELVACAIHEGSSLADGPLIVLNCGAIPRELAGSELFGHRRGAFTGAVDTHRGAFERADGGTLFLDEVGELPLEVQPLLLRALETGEVRALGSEQTKQVRVRVVAATHRDLREEGRFREDLYYRLAVVKLQVPPLRERPDDIEPLARRFGHAAGIEELPAALVERLKTQPWPGNVRELRNTIQAYAAVGALPEDSSQREALRRALAEFIDVTRPYTELKEELNDIFTPIYLDALLEEAGQNQSAAAKIAQMDRTYLGRLLNKYGRSKE